MMKTREPIELSARWREPLASERTLATLRARFAAAERDPEPNDLWSALDALGLDADYAPNAADPTSAPTSLSASAPLSSAASSRRVCAPPLDRSLAPRALRAEESAALGRSDAPSNASSRAYSPAPRRSLASRVQRFDEESAPIAAAPIAPSSASSRAYSPAPRRSLASRAQRFDEESAPIAAAPTAPSDASSRAFSPAPLRRSLASRARRAEESSALGRSSALSDASSSELLRRSDASRAARSERSERTVAAPFRALSAPSFASSRPSASDGSLARAFFCAEPFVASRAPTPTRSECASTPFLARSSSRSRFGAESAPLAFKSDPTLSARSSRPFAERAIEPPREERSERGESRTFAFEDALGANDETRWDSIERLLSESRDALAALVLAESREVALTAR